MLGNPATAVITSRYLLIVIRVSLRFELFHRRAGRSQTCQRAFRTVPHIVSTRLSCFELADLERHPCSSAPTSTVEFNAISSADQTKPSTGYISEHIGHGCPKRMRAKDRQRSVVPPGTVEFGSTQLGRVTESTSLLDDLVRCVRKRALLLPAIIPLCAECNPLTIGLPAKAHAAKSRYRSESDQGRERVAP
jgi:hypothetical protein